MDGGSATLLVIAVGVIVIVVIGVLFMLFERYNNRR